MNKRLIQNKIKLKKEELKKVLDKKNEAPDFEVRFLIQQQLRIAQEIADLEWQLLSSFEKQNYRKTILNASKKWGSVKGSEHSKDKKKILDLIIAIYDLSEEILEFDELPDNIRNSVINLKGEIDRKKYIG